MEGTPGTREPRARPRERDPDRRTPADRDRHRERSQDRPRDPHRERNRDGRRDGNRREDRDRERDRDPRRDRRRDAAHRAGEQRVWGESRQSRTRDAAPQPWPAPGAAPEPPPLWKEGLGRRGPESEPTSGRYLSSNSRPGQDEVEYYQSEAEGLLECHKCKYLCTGRACCQLLEVLLNLLILACSAVSYNSTGGYTGITSLGGIYYYQFGGAYSGFDGADGEKAQQLDVQFYQLKLPTVTAAMAYSGALMAFSCLLVVAGVLRVPWHCPLWLVIEGLLDVLIAVGYVPALYFYFHYLSDAYSSPVCKEREALYQSKGYSGFGCSFHGGDIGAGIFAALGIGVFALGAVLAIRGYRKVRKLKEKPAEMFQF
ncbi:PREDICTED: MARVEL domain-containing protein 3 isoform X1 [Propithecus coquereli]|uniref:MARVEL domain-containing protein 3 isoform X1 n=1 Tax=Propithecus coquereli TaxID=379532 RepID=UPI00063F4711|nr:PREDICTED: MARVEL domain-containing protein 3 isoform X1 [Propithecus coquereli]